MSNVDKDLKASKTDESVLEKESPNLVPSQTDFPKPRSANTSLTASNRWPISKVWLLAIASIALSISLVYWSISTRGDTITIRFLNGHTIKPESRVVFRGIEVGVVEAVQLDEQLEIVLVTVRLAPTARHIACEGSLFWIERPIIDFHNVRGLETVVGGRYINVSPGPDPSKLKNQFIGVESPRPKIPNEAGLEILIEANKRNGLREGSPIVYRGLEVGRILSVALSSDSRWVQCRAWINDEYRDLVRDNSMFWNESGFQIDFGLSGLEIEADSLESIVAGGIAFSTPDAPGNVVKTGHRFELAEQADPAWLTWRPRMLHGQSLLRNLESIPTSIRCSLNWKERFLGFPRPQQRIGWVTLLDNGTMIVPSDLLQPPSNALAPSHWEVAGKEISIAEILSAPNDSPVASDKPFNNPALKEVADSEPLRLVPIPPALQDQPHWKSKKIRVMDLTKSDLSVAIVTGRGGQVLPVEPHQMSLVDNAIQLSTSLELTPDLHGSPCINATDGTLVGIIVFKNNQYLIAPITR